MVGVTKLRIKFGPNCWVRTVQIPEECMGSKKRGREETEEEVGKEKKKKKQKRDSCIRECLSFLRDHRFGRMFSEPARLKIPDYLSVVSNPMDLGTIESKVLKNSYKNRDEFAADVRLTFTNAMLYHPPGNYIHKRAKELKEVFEVQWKKLLEEGSKTVSKDVSLLSVKEQSTETCQARNTSEAHTDLHSKDEKTACAPSKFKRTSCATPLRAAILKAEAAMRAKHRKDEFERRQRKAELRAAMLKQMRDRHRLKIEQMEGNCGFEDNNYRRLHEDLVLLCGTSNPTRSCLPELGLFRRDDDDMEESLFGRSDADVEEGEILD